MFCNKCGTQLPDDSCFCNKCGNKLQCFDDDIAPSTNDYDDLSVCDVVLLFSGEQKDEIVQLLRNTMGLTRDEARRVVDNTPALACGELSYAEAELLRSGLEKLGADSEICATPADRIYYQNEFECIYQAYSNLTKDCIPSLRIRNQMIDILVECNKELWTCGALSTAAGLAFKRSTIKRYDEYAPMTDTEIKNSQSEMEAAVRELNKRYGNMYFVYPPEIAANEMATGIYQYINSFAKKFEKWI